MRSWRAFAAGSSLAGSHANRASSSRRGAATCSTSIPSRSMHSDSRCSSVAAADDVVEGSELRSALGWWRGAAFEGFDDVAICAEEGRRLDGLRIAATEMRVDLDLADHVDATLVAELETLVAEHPFRERFWEQLILSLYRLGRQTEALAAYKRARRVLIDEIGVEPGPGLRHLEAAILDHDVALLSAPRQRGRRVVPPALDASGVRVRRPRRRRGDVAHVVVELPERIGWLRVGRSDRRESERPVWPPSWPTASTRRRRRRALCAVRSCPRRTAPAVRRRTAQSGLVDHGCLRRVRRLGRGDGPASGRVATGPAGVGRAGRSPPCRRRDAVGSR